MEVIMTAGNLESFANENYSNRYIQFRAFYEKSEYKDYWNLCIKAVNDVTFLLGGIFLSMVFKDAFAYKAQEVLRINENLYFNVKTASNYIK